MAQLKDTIIQGDARVTDTLYSNTVNASTLSVDDLSAKKLTVIASTDSASNITQGINFKYNNTNTGLISTNNGGWIGIYSSGQMVLRPNSTLDTTNNTWSATTGITISSSDITPTSTTSLGTSSAKWSNLYATLISPDKVRINTTSTTSQNLYVNGTVRVYLGSSNISVTDRKFTIAGGSTSQYEISIGGEAIQAYNASQVAKNLFFQPYSGDIYIGSSGDTLAASALLPNRNNRHNIGSTTYKWADLYATLISPDRIRVNTNLTWDVSAYDFYVSGSSRFYLGSSNHGVADRKFTIIGNNELSFGDEGIQAFDTSQVAKTLYLQPRGGDLVFGQASSVSTTAYSFKPNQDNKHNLGASNAKWANVYATNLHGSLATSNLTGQVAVANGGTGASDAANARTNLGLGTIAVKDTDDYYSIGSGCSTLVSSTQDFDTLTTFGNYYRSANADTVNMTHLPQKQAFTLKVMSATGSNNRIRQVFQSYNKSIIYMRSKSSAADATWTAWQYQPVVTPAENDGTYTLTKGSASLPVYVDSDGEIQPITSLSINDITASSSFVFSGMAEASANYARPVWFMAGSGDSPLIGMPGYDSSFTYNPSTNRLVAGVYQAATAASAATNTSGLDFVNGTTLKAHIGVSTDAGAMGLYAAENIYIRPSCTLSSNTFTSSYGVVVSSTSLHPASTSNAPSLGNSTNKWSNVYTGLITPNAATYTTTTTAGIVFYNSSALCGHIGAATGGAAPGSIGLQTTGQIVFRAGATLSSGVLDGDYGMNLTSTELAPKTNAAALDTTGALTLGSSTAQWVTTYSKQYVVDEHVTLAYDSTDKSLNFNFA